MPLISGMIPGMMNGVSQQDPHLRLPTQGELQDNGFSSLVEGLVKRPPTQYIAKLNTLTSDDVFVHFINRDENERYVVIIQGQTITVYGLDGTSYPVTLTDAAYLPTTQTRTSLRAMTLADTTLITNTQMKTRMSASLAPVRNGEALIWVKAGNYDVQYTIKLGGKTFTHTTGKADDSTAKIGTNDVTVALYNLMTKTDGSGLDSTKFSVTRNGNHIWVKRINTNISSPIGITAFDSTGNTYVSVVGSTAQAISDLPNYAPNGYIVKIVSDAEDAKDAYWVQFSTLDDEAFGEGTWEEARRPEGKYAIDGSTMPHILVRNQDPTTGAISFEFKPASWANRNSGDSTSNPNPSFIGCKISDMFLHKNRLGFLSDTKIILSRAGDYFNFFRKSAITLLDEDPIDVAVASARVSPLLFAIPFNEELVIFSDRIQYSLVGGDVLSPKTVSVRKSTEYDVSTGCRPLCVGNCIYFAFDNSGYTGVREFFVDQTTGEKDAIPVTAHAPRYIPTNVWKVAGSSVDNLLLVHSGDEMGSLYVYKWFNNGNDRLQSSWSRWTFTGIGGVEQQTAKILSFDLVGSTVYMVIQRAEGTFLERMVIAPGQLDDQEVQTGCPIFMDRRSTESILKSITYNATTGKTTLQFNWPISTVHHVRIRADCNGWKAGQYVATAGIGSDYILCTGDLRGVPLWIGTYYEFRYQFSPVVLRTQTPMGGQIGVSDGRLQLRTFSITYQDSYTLDVTHKRRSSGITVQTKQVSVKYDSDLNMVSDSDIVRLFIQGEADDQIIEVSDFSAWPVKLISAAWEGTYHTRSRRV